MKKFTTGPLLIMIAASLWAIDALFRTQLTFTIPVTVIVLLEHTLGFFILSPILVRQIGTLRSISSKTWLQILAMTIISSVGGTLLFTQALNLSFANNDFVTPILLQKLQPVFVVALSALFLKERLTGRFLFLSAIALLGSYLLSFGTSLVSLSFEGKELVVLLALGAAACWGGGTILSKAILTKVNFPLATVLRFLFAIPVAYGAMFIMNESYSLVQMSGGEVWRFLVIAGITGGALALYLYYKGLQKTQAKVSTFAELMLPVVTLGIAVTPLNPYGAPQMLSIGNMVGILLLLTSILAISLGKAK